MANQGSRERVNQVKGPASGKLWFQLQFFSSSSNSSLGSAPFSRKALCFSQTVLQTLESTSLINQPKPQCACPSLPHPPYSALRWQQRHHVAVRTMELATVAAMVHVVSESVWQRAGLHN